MNTIETDRFLFRACPLPDVWEVNRKPIRDNRGFFSRFFCEQEFSRLGVDIRPTQINFSYSPRAGTVRGLHYQYHPHAETKIVTCMHGEIFDVAVDLRRDSPTFLQWFGITLSAEQQNSLVIPPGVAHGFQSLVENSDVLYLVTSPYDRTLEDGLHPLDPALAIRWPLQPTEISERDRNRSYIDPATYPGLTQQGGHQ